MHRYKGIKREISELLRRKKVLYLAIAVCLISMIVTGVSIAWLSDQSDTIANNFQTAEVSCEISETFIDDVKSNVRIKNTGSMDTYIRAALVPVWKDGDDVAGVHASLSDCDIDWGDAYGFTWVYGNDGYYYCIIPIGAGDFTPYLINECTVITQNNYRFELQIAAQAVQALPVSAVEDIWVAVTSVDAHGTLEVAQ